MSHHIAFTYDLVEALRKNGHQVVAVRPFPHCFEVDGVAIEISSPELSAGDRDFDVGYAQDVVFTQTLHARFPDGSSDEECVQQAIVSIEEAIAKDKTYRRSVMHGGGQGPMGIGGVLHGIRQEILVKRLRAEAPPHVGVQLRGGEIQISTGFGRLAEAMVAAVRPAQATPAATPPATTTATPRAKRISSWTGLRRLVSITGLACSFRLDCEGQVSVRVVKHNGALLSYEGSSRRACLLACVEQVEAETTPFLFDQRDALAHLADQLRAHAPTRAKEPQAV